MLHHLTCSITSRAPRVPPSRYTISRGELFSDSHNAGRVGEINGYQAAPFQITIQNCSVVPLHFTIQELPEEIQLTGGSDLKGEILPIGPASS